ncbi:MAG: DUF4147 domain-containing protein [Gemmatimonadales bacterium]|nr:MAG: DUF4147 domain-containing protein [Gemmatimonadales bacterium]
MVESRAERRVRTRAVVEELFGAALAAVEPAGLVFRWLDRNLLPPISGSLVVVALGKAAHGMVRGARAALGPQIARGMVVVPGAASGSGGGIGRALGAHHRFQVLHGGHPVPDQGSVSAGAALLELAEGLGPEDLLLVLLSGGGSALAAVPAPPLSLADVAEATRVLLDSGAPITEVNAVRRGMDLLKGGGLARAAHPARVVTLAISDVVGDPPADIASGPTVARPTSDPAVAGLLEARGVCERLPPQVRECLEGVARGGGAAGRVDRTRTEWHLVGSNRLALEGVRDRAERHGRRVRLLPDPLAGEAREVGRVLAGIGMELSRDLGPGDRPLLLVAGGETTVTVRGPGRGGRNQEVALGAGLALARAVGAIAQGYGAGGEGRGHGEGEADGGGEGGAAARAVTVAALGTDGVDGPTDAAGAVADASTVARARAAGGSVEAALRDNDAYPLLASVGDLILTGPTGTNVMDLFLVLVDPPLP